MAMAMAMMTVTMVEGVIPVIVLLPRSVPHLQLHLDPIHLNVSDIVLKDCGHILLGEFIPAKDNEEAGFSTGSVPHDHQFLSHNCRHSLVEVNQAIK